MHSLQRKFQLAFIFFTGLQISAVHAQHYQKEPQPELTLGLKVVTRKILYDKNDLYKTDPGSIGLQPGIRYDIPLKISTDHYIDLSTQAGFLFCKANVFDTSFTDPNTNVFIHDHSYNPAYLPVYVGMYNMSALSVGAELFYWKGLGTRDIWGVKFLSLGYNGKQYRFAVAGEWYAQVKNGKHAGLLFSVDVFCKLIRDRK